MSLEVKVRVEQTEARGGVMTMPASPTNFEATESPVSNL